MARVNIELNPIFERLEKELGTVNRKVNRLTKTFNKNSRSSTKAASSGNLAAKAFRAVGVAIAGIGIAVLARGFINIAKTFEILRIRLRTFTGSQQESNDEWERLISIAARTQVDVDQLITAYTTLRTVGITPLNEEILRLADFSAASGQSFEQLTNIIFRGASSTELFYNIGVIARKEGEKLRVTFQGVTEVIDGTSRGILDYITALTESNGFTGAATEIAEGLTGSLSNITGNFKALVEQIGVSSGAIDGIAGVFAGLAESFANWRTALVSTPEPLEAFVNLGKQLVAVMKEIAIVIGILAVRAAALWIAALGPVGLAILILVAAIAAFGDDTKSILGQIVGFFYKAFLDLKTIILTVLPNAFGSLVRLVNIGVNNVLVIITDFFNSVVTIAANALAFFGADELASKLRGFSSTLSAYASDLETESTSFRISIEKNSQEITDAFQQNLDDANALVDGFTRAEAAITSLQTTANVSSNTSSGPAGGPSIAALAEEKEVAATESRRERIEKILAKSLNNVFDLHDINFESLLEAAEFNYGEQLLKIEEKIEKEMLIESEAYLLRLDAFTAFEQKRTEIADAQEEQRLNKSYAYGLLDIEQKQSLENLTNKQKGQALKKGLSELAAYSEKAFLVNKALAIASAIVNTYQGASKALAQGGFFGIALAGITVATGLAQVAAIGAQSYNPPRQFGGSVEGGKAGLVGENGPEMFVPDSDGEIIPNEADGGPGSGNSVVQNITVQAGSLSEMLEQLNELAIDRSGEGFTGRPIYDI